MERLQRVLQARSMGGEGPAADHEQVDTAEQVYISSLALLKMLKHGELLHFHSSGRTLHNRRPLVKPYRFRIGPKEVDCCWADSSLDTAHAGRAGVPLEVMGLMLGEFLDSYTVKVVDVFAMPQSGTGVSVEAVDPVYQTKMLDMLKQVGR